MEALRSQAERLGIAGRVSFLGERDDVSRLLSAADIYCQPNEGPEPFGLSYVEALAAGLPVVASRLGALPEIVDDGCGVLVDPGSPARVADALERVMNPAVRQGMRTRAVERAAIFGDVRARLTAVAAALQGAATSTRDVSSPIRP
jgi:glycosyltransferase involved in cell wall biosynthesis